jgi:hypothetical protein
MRCEFEFQLLEEKTTVSEFITLRYRIYALFSFRNRFIRMPVDDDDKTDSNDVEAKNKRR